MQPSDIRNAVAVLKPLRQKKGIFGDPSFQKGCDPRSDMGAVFLRSTLLLSMLERDAMAEWRDKEEAVFEVIATYPITQREDASLDFNLEAFIRTLEGSHGGAH